MSIGSVKYNQYGMDKIATVSNATMATAYDLDINDGTGRIKTTWVFGSLQTDVDAEVAMKYSMLDASDNALTMHGAVTASTTTGRSGAGLSTEYTEANFIYWTAQNADYTTYSGKMAHFWFKIHFNVGGQFGNSLAKHRRHIEHQCITYTANCHIAHGNNEIKSTTLPRKIKFLASSSGYGSANVTLNATSYAVFNDYTS